MTPAPKHAAYVWTVGETLWLGLPPLTGELHGHSLHFEATPLGLAAMLKVLKHGLKSGRTAEDLGL
jgi:hypothetical protein